MTDPDVWAELDAGDRRLVRLCNRPNGHMVKRESSRTMKLESLGLIDWADGRCYVGTQFGRKLIAKHGNRNGATK